LSWTFIDKCTKQHYFDYEPPYS